MEAAPASVAKIAEKVAKAAKVVQKKAESKRISNVEKVRKFMEKKGKHSVADVAKGTGLTSKQCSDILWRLWQEKELKSSEVGSYSK